LGFNRYTICSLHALLSDNLLPTPSAGGRLRVHAVSIGRSVFYPLEVPQLIEDRFEEMLTKASLIEDAFEQSFFIMVQLPDLQPFEDVNKRVSRLAANISLVINPSSLSSVDVPKDDYLQATLAVYEFEPDRRISGMFRVGLRALLAPDMRPSGNRSGNRTHSGSGTGLRWRNWWETLIRGVMDKTAAVAFLRRRVPELVPAEDRERSMNSRKW